MHVLWINFNWVFSRNKRAAFTVLTVVLKVVRKGGFRF